MAIEGVEQPAYIQIEDDLRLRRYDGTADFALPSMPTATSLPS